MIATINILDEVNVKISGLREGDITSLAERFAVFAKGYRHQIKYKLGQWDGKIRFFHRDGKTYVKLLDEILPYLRSEGYEINLKDKRPDVALDIPPIDKNYLKNKGFDVELGEHQVRGVNALTHHLGGIFEGGTGAGKAQPLYSKVLTPNGWKCMGDVAVNDKLVDPTDGSTVNVIGVFPQGKKPIYELKFHDGSSARACDEHLWKVKIPRKWNKTKREEKIVDTQTIIDFISRKKAGEMIPRNISIPMTAPVDMTPRDFIIEPYCLGLLIGDGHLSGTPRISSSDHEIITSLSESFVGLGVEVSYSSGYDYYISKKTQKKNQHMKNPISEELKRLNLWDTRSNNKFIPDEYLNSSISQRYHLLQGLMDTDGTVDKRGSCSYSTSSKTLAHNVQELCWSLGMVCTLREKKTTHQNSYTLHIGSSKPKDLFRLDRKRERCSEMFTGNRCNLERRIVDVEFIGYEDAQCIMVDSESHLYITDDYVVTHNTLMTAVLCHLVEEELGHKCIVIVPTSDLIDQTHKELVEYGIDAGQYGGTLKDINHTHVVSTWQSLQNNKGLIGSFKTVIVDECHGVTGRVLQEILNEHGSKCLIRMGLTGTIPEEDIDRMHVRVTLGDVVEKVEASELIANGWLAELKLYCYELIEDLRDEYHKFCEEYPDKAGDLSYTKYKAEFFADYQSEKKYLQKTPERIDFLASIIGEPQQNTLVLVPNVDFGRKIAKQIPNAVFFYGKDSKAVRKELYSSFDEKDDIIAVTTYSLASTGLNIKRIFNLFLIDAGKSYVQVIQSIGRGLRKAHDKDKVRVYDIHSDFKFSHRHALARRKHYRDKSYPYKVQKVDYRQLVE